MAREGIEYDTLGITRATMLAKSHGYKFTIRNSSRAMKTTASNAAIPNRLDLGIVLGQLCAIAACIGVLRYSVSGWAVALLAMLFGIVMNSVYSIIHEAEHAMLFSKRRCNDLAGSLMAL